METSRKDAGLKKELLDLDIPGVTFVTHQRPLAVNLVAAQAFDIAVVRVVHVEHGLAVAVHDGFRLVGVLNVTVAIAADFGFGGGCRLGDAMTVLAAKEALI